MKYLKYCFPKLKVTSSQDQFIFIEDQRENFNLLMPSEIHLLDLVAEYRENQSVAWDGAKTRATAQPGFAHLQSVPQKHSGRQISLVCLLLSLPVVGSLTQFCLSQECFWLGANLCVDLRLAEAGSVPSSALWSLLCDLGLLRSAGLWVRVCRQGQWREGNERRRKKERVVISKGSGVVFCSKLVHWMVAGSAECLPMAQLFANLTPPLHPSNPPPPIGLGCNLPPSLDYPPSPQPRC